MNIMNLQRIRLKFILFFADADLQYKKLKNIIYILGIEKI